MQRRLVPLAAFVALVLTVLPTLPVLAIDEPERLWLVGEKAFVDNTGRDACGTAAAGVRNAIDEQIQTTIVRVERYGKAP